MWSGATDKLTAVTASDASNSPTRTRSRQRSRVSSSSCSGSQASDRSLETAARKLATKTAALVSLMAKFRCSAC